MSNKFEYTFSFTVEEMNQLQELLIKTEAATDRSSPKYDLYRSILREIDSKSIKNFINNYETEESKTATQRGCETIGTL